MIDFRTFVFIFLFIATGVVTPLAVEVIALNGGSEKSTLLIALPTGIGLSLSIFTNWKSRNLGKIQWGLIIGVACVDVVAQVLNLNGLIAAGSAIYTIVSSSSTIYIAIFSYFFLNRQLHVGQWLGLIVVMVGLSIATADAQSYGSSVFLGVVLILIGSMVHSAMYIVSEYLLVFTDDPISPELLSTLLGASMTSVNLAWQVVYTIPRYQTLIVDEIAAYHGSAYLIVGGYVVLVLSALVHGVSLFSLLGIIGSTSTGLIKAVKSVALFVVSHVAFCSVKESQCFTYWKGFSLVVVLVGVFVYTQFQPHSAANADSPGLNSLSRSRINSYQSIISDSSDFGVFAESPPPLPLDLEQGSEMVPIFDGMHSGSDTGTRSRGFSSSSSFSSSLGNRVRGFSGASFLSTTSQGRIRVSARGASYGPEDLELLGNM